MYYQDYINYVHVYYALLNRYCPILCLGVFTAFEVHVHVQYNAL